MKKIVILLLACVISLCTQQPKPVVSCNLSGSNWLAIQEQPCKFAPVLVVPSYTRLFILSGPHYACSKKWYRIGVANTDAGYVESDYLCEILPGAKLFPNDMVQPCKMGSWDFLNMFYQPFTTGRITGRFERGWEGRVLEGPIYNNQKLYMYFVESRFGNRGWVDAEFLCSLGLVNTTNFSKVGNVSNISQSGK